MNVKEARSFLREHHRGILATVRTDGRPQMQDQGRVLVRIDIERAGPNRHA